jgi:glutamyl-Q tRNA(Asp) synthetase
MVFTTRFAPSPTGFLHLGHAYSAFCAQSRARAAGGVFLLRLEDIDTARCKPAFAAAIAEDLAWLGLHWDDEIRVQSAHFADYQAALEILAARGLLYPCFCSRAEILRAQTAPHGDEAVYPGICRDLPAAERAARLAQGAAYALRLNMRLALEGVADLRFFEERQGWIDAAPMRFGDVVLARKDTPSSYHLCVVHDDAAQNISHVIRGEDLLAATHIHVLLQRLLGFPTPVYTHHPLLADETGKRLAKRDKAATIRALRAAGISATAILKQFEGAA